ncbi:restriction endonuclease subunit S [Porphyromonas levii]|uniref:restriction endonuclease subunit S n=1 Tax=Porphyromonas levii TaxID=28114 RepID=UPI001B8CC06D|nr:restriction endonuclease subunit S [Porphyromonas levii]MBR8713095.1 hypothetical protein [Porphyromonas levii]MBR8715101.1 hypothetical protein [Porphyromonas levii]MBR8727626.1 hypothetical protein [Porphyromonas levii]MBR8735962.1 hypothetical protein [Porphyromonas levii]MBR8765080.1 hypothetical protein [Porphyromonas levii]
MMERYKAYKESGLPWLGTMPEHWEVKRIKDIFTEISDKGYADEPILCSTQKFGVIPQSMYENRIVIVNKGLENLKLVRQGNFVISLRSFQGGIEYAHYQGIISAAYTVLQLAKGFNEIYIKYLLKSSAFIQLLQICTTGIREGRNVNYSVLKQESLPVPPLEEQRAIAEYLDRETVRIDRIVELLTKQRERYAQLKRSLISEVVTHGLPHHNPANYRTLRLKDIVSSFETGKRETTSIEEVLSIGGEHIQNGKFFLENPRYVSKEFYNSNNGKIKIGDTLVVKDGATIGKSMFVDSLPSEQMLLNEHVYRLEPNRLFCLPIYLYYIINSTATQEYFRAMNMSTAQESITRITMNSLPISLPPLEEQQEIVAYLDERCKRLDRLVEAIDRKIDLLGSLKKSLIEEVVTGQRRITN